MTRHTGLGRHSGIKEAVGDPLDGLVNLFDIGIVLAVAFLIAGLGLHGQPVGEVYRLSNGQLVYVQKQR